MTPDCGLPDPAIPAIACNRPHGSARPRVRRPRSAHRWPIACNRPHGSARLQCMIAPRAANSEDSTMERALTVTMEMLAYAFITGLIAMILVENL